MKARTKKSAVPSIKRDPTEAERSAIAQAAERKASRPARSTVDLAGQDAGALTISNSHSDPQGWGDHLNDTFGTRSHAFTDQAFSRIASIASDHGKVVTQTQINAALALMGAVAPKDELEATIAEQITASHLLSMDLMQRAKHADLIPKMESYVNMATKVSRTMASLVETLSKHRAGGKQQVEVRYVYVDARNSQNIIGSGPGAGAWPGNGDRPCEPPTLAGPQIALGAPLWGQDAGGAILPSAGHQGQEAVQAPRRHEPRRSGRKSQRTLPARPLDQGDGGHA
jgi:hypothetical protein